MPADHRPAQRPRRFRLRAGSSEVPGVPSGLQRMWAAVLRRFRDHLDDIGPAKPHGGADETTDQNTAEDACDPR